MPKTFLFTPESLTEGHPDLKLGYKFIFRGMQPDYGMIYEYDLICYIDNEQRDFEKMRGVL